MNTPIDPYDELDEKVTRGDVTVHSVGSLRDGSRVSDSELEELFAGRPSLGHSHATRAGRSPRRQVRLPADTNAALDAYVAAHNTTPSAVIRDALEHYLTHA